VLNTQLRIGRARPSWLLAAGCWLLAAKLRSCEAQGVKNRTLAYSVERVFSRWLLGVRVRGGQKDLPDVGCVGGLTSGPVSGISFEK